MPDTLYTCRAVFISSPCLESAGAAERAALEALGRTFRIVGVPPGPGAVRRMAREAGIEPYASWLIGEGPAPGLRGALSPGPGGLARALAEVRRAEGASRIVVESERLARVAEKARRRGERIVFTNGVFDLLHLGHLRLLEGARRLGDLLIVGINSDDSTRRIKGEGRPVVAQFARAEHLVRLRAVDWCFIFTEDDPRRVLSLLRPDVLVKGGDYALSGVVGGRLVSSWGGRVARVPIVEGFSTTASLSSLRLPRRKS